MSNSSSGATALPALPKKLERGIDELNFAEFPVCLFSSNPVHVAESGKTLEFQDEIPDPQNPGKTLNRSVTVTGTDKWGLPTVLDDWVILGLLQLAKLQGFPKKLSFTRYHLLKLLGWGTNARDYNKLTECLRRIQGVQFTFEKAWWDGKANSWVSRTFNLYQDLEIYDAENSTTRPKPDICQTSFIFVCSSFEWSEFLHSNFMNRAVKGLNFHFVKSLRKPTAKRLFRFLDKRFYNKNRLEFDMHEFAEAHMGLRKGQKVGDIKRTLGSAIAELEEHGYLRPMPADERFPKIKRGVYRIIFEKGAFDPSIHETELEEIDQTATIHTKRVAQSMVDRGVSEKEALRISSAFADSLIRHHIDVFDWENSEGKKIPNPGGYLRTRIIENYTDPKGFIPRLERERLKEEKARKLERKAQALEQQQLNLEQEQERRAKRIEEYWVSLGAEERAAAEEEAIGKANRTQIDWMKRDGLLKQSTIQNLMDAYAEKQLAELK